MDTLDAIIIALNFVCTFCIGYVFGHRAATKAGE